MFFKFKYMMECEVCQNEFDIYKLKAYILLPCIHILCVLCVGNQSSCPKCNSTITSKLAKRLTNEISHDDFLNSSVKIYQDKYKEICFLESGGYGCVYIVKNLIDQKM